MQGSIRPETVITALAVMSEARERLARDVAPGDFELAKRIATAEGSLRGALIQALPERVEVRGAA
jgi:hypothetical protein